MKRQMVVTTYGLAVLLEDAAEQGMLDEAASRPVMVRIGNSCREVRGVVIRKSKQGEYRLFLEAAK